MFDDLNLVHIHGPVELQRSINQVVVLCVVKNAEHLVDSFIQHYQNSAYAHIIFLDNGSTDRTVPKACSYKNVTVFASDASFAEKKHLMRYFLMKNFGAGNWFLMVDIDELFVYPYSKDISLTQFVHYLNQNSYTGVVAHMLDMAPTLTLKQLKINPVQSIESSEWSFNIAEITRHPYEIGSNILPNDRISTWRGGIRKLLLGHNCLLTKHPLNLGDGKIITHGSHKIGNRVIADVTGLLLHYKFVGDFYTEFMTAARQRQHFNNSMAYRMYIEAFEADPEMNFYPSSSEKYLGLDQLEALGLFEYSHRYHELRQV